MRRSLGLLALGSALVAGASSCTSSTEAAGSSTRSTEPARSSTRSTELAIYEAVFRHQFRFNASGMQASAPAYFLSIEDRDPPRELLDRFAGHRPPVRPGSEFEMGEGILFRIDRVERIDSTTVEVSGGYYEGNLSASGNTYRLELREGSWVVVSDVMHWIS